VSGELNREIAGKAIWAFHNDGANAVAGDAVEYVLEAFPRSASCLPRGALALIGRYNAALWKQPAQTLLLFGSIQRS
jgi:hypothetical protein